MTHVLQAKPRLGVGPEAAISFKGIAGIHDDQVFCELCKSEVSQWIAALTEMEQSMLCDEAAIAKKRVDFIVQTLSDGDCGRFYSYEQCNAMAAEGRELCEKWNLDVPARIKITPS